MKVIVNRTFTNHWECFRYVKNMLCIFRMRKYKFKRINYKVDIRERIATIYSMEVITPLTNA